MIYKVNFRLNETSENNNVYVGADSEDDAKKYVSEILIPAISGHTPYHVWVEQIFKSRSK